ncbi:sperm tail-domain-containing protein [Entophlyctis helioformis]|nr:sperm tail-domain-containing protein [Entophlyctis helioformis]
MGDDGQQSSGSGDSNAAGAQGIDSSSAGAGSNTGNQGISGGVGDSGNTGLGGSGGGRSGPSNTNTSNNNNNSNSSNNNGGGSGPSGGGGNPSSSVNDGGREARIAVRKGRIELNRLAKAKPSENVDGNGMTRRIKKIEPEQKETGKAKAQIAASQKRIETVRTGGNELVTNIRVGVTARESLRRQEEVRKVDVWKKKRHDEQAHSSLMKDDIVVEWDKIAKLGGPYELNEMLNRQKEACSALMAIKNKLIGEYVAELKSKDDEYVKELKRQAEEIDKLLERMEAQYKTFQGTLVEELEHIEKAFVEERTELIDANVRDIEQLFETRRQNEAKYMHERADRIEDHIKQLEALRVHDAEEYNLVKIKLETDVQVLEQQLQQMRATYQLNTEKLEYNFQVLKKREEENGTILGAQKRKINRLTDHLNLLKAKAAKQERTFQQENMSLSEDHKHLTEQFKELQKKFRHFQMADSKKYQEVWKMNEEEARELMRKVLQADRIIYEQQLGMRWSPPREDLFRNIDPSFFQEMVEDESKNIQDAQAAFEDNMEDRLATSNVEGDSDKKESLAAKFQDHKGHSKTMKKTLELLCNEAGFLVEDKLQKLLAPLHRDEQSLMKLDSIFKALGVETVEDIERLTSYFVAETNEARPATGTNAYKSKAQLLTDDNTILIHPNEVVRAIRKYVELNRESSSGPGGSGGGSRGGRRTGTRSPQHDSPYDAEDKDLNGFPATTLRAQQPHNTSAKVRDLQKEYWERMANVIDDKSYRTWNAVYLAMNKHNEIVTHRWQLSQEIHSVRHQNEELKALLRQYMAARINDELQIPPTQIMLAQAGMLQSGH